MQHSSTDAIATMLDHYASGYRNSQSYFADNLSAAAQRLRDLEAENKRLTAILEAQTHSVEVSEVPTGHSFVKTVRIDAAITHPVRYFAELAMDPWEVHTMRDDAVVPRVDSMMRNLTEQWRRDLVEAAVPEFVNLCNQWKREMETNGYA